jgi:adenylate cyclase
MERKLLAILCADVCGYSRLMGSDEEGTLTALTSHRNNITNLIERHHGRFVNSAGDSVLAEFTSVVEAVNCAVEIQGTITAANVNLPAERRMEFRVGVNLGDVMVEGEQIYGDGVNVAARLESLADPGGICISGVVYDQVKGKLTLHYQDLGAQQVKNIAEPLRVWRVLLNGVAASQQDFGQVRRKYWPGGPLSVAGIAIIVVIFALVQHLSLRPQLTHASIPTPSKPALSPPSVPSIAVLPFANLSSDPQQEYFSDGITDDLITDLSRVPKLFVIARTSSFSYKGKPEKVQQVGRELGVKYLLEGSTRRAGDQVRINVQLVDAATGNDVWSQRYDRQMRDIFKLQDEIVRSLTTTVGLQLSVLEKAMIYPQETKNLEAYDYLLRGLEDALSPTPVAFVSARTMFEKAISLDPGYADAYASLSMLHLWSHLVQRDIEPDALDRADELAHRAVLLDDSNSNAYAVLGWVAAFRNHPDQAIADGERAITLDPNCAFAYLALSDISGDTGKPEAQLAYAKKAMRLDPSHPEPYFLEIGWAYLVTGRYREAIDALTGAQADQPFTHVGLSYAYMELGREQEAKGEAAKVLRLSPKFSLEMVKKTYPGDWNSPPKRHFLDDLHKAGLK